MRSQPSLELGQHQHLVLTPQLRQALRLLHCSSQELEHELAQTVADNPLLESVDAAPGPDPARAEWLERRWAQPVRGPISDDIPESGAAPSLTDHLLRQLHVTRATERDCLLVMRLIGELDERGYLEFDPQALSASMAPELIVEEDEWRPALSLLQSFDPAGIAARDLPESLRLQLRARAAQCPPAVLDCALRLTAHLEDLAAGRWGRLSEQLGCDRALLEAAHRALRQLDPRPASAWDGQDIQYIVPDVLFYREGSNWRVSLNPALESPVRLNPDLVASLEACESREISEALQDQLRQARGLVRQLGQRRQTILRVAEIIVLHQRDFLEQGVRALKPLLLRDVAQALDLHESTISRATRLKYAQTPWGVFELKQFFGAGVQTAQGDETSARAVQALLRALLEAEPGDRPLSDQRLAELLAERGIVIARRTVAKYREGLGIPTASVRRARRTG